MKKKKKTNERREGRTRDLQFLPLGGHINPAVTFGLFFARKLSLTRAVFYIVMQVAQAVERVPNVQTLSNILGLLISVLVIFCVRKSNLALKMGKMSGEEIWSSVEKESRKSLPPFDNSSGYNSKTGVYQSLENLGTKHEIPTDQNLNTASLVLSQFPQAKLADAKIAFIDLNTNHSVTYSELHRSVYSLGVFEWFGNNPLPPEIWLLPYALPVHPGSHSVAICNCDYPCPLNASYFSVYSISTSMVSRRYRMLDGKWIQHGFKKILNV